MGMALGVLAFGGLIVVALLFADKSSASSSSSSNTATTSGSGGTPSLAGGGNAALPNSANHLLTPNQQTFASALAGDTGLDPSVVSAWLLAEESGGAAQSREAAHNNDWLNIGYTGSGTFGASDSVWNDPVTAAHTTAAWMQGTYSLPGFGKAASGITTILQSAGKSAQAQIQALQQSPWDGGYPSLPQIYSEVTG